MLEQIQDEIKKLPQVITRQQVLNWYTDTIEHKWGSKKEITTGELIILIEKAGKKVQGQSKLAIHITPEEEKEFTEERGPGRRAKIIPDTEKEKLKNMYSDCKMNMMAIAKIYKCSSSTVQARLQDFEIEIRHNNSSKVAVS